jgi:phosphoglycolate phosphatase
MNRGIPKPRAILFDWDDTLIDNWRPIHTALNVTLTAMGHEPWSFEQTRKKSRHSLRDSFPKLFGNRWEEARELFYASFPEDHLETITVLSGAQDMLELLSNTDVYLGVVSNKQGHTLRREMAHLGWNRYFRRVVGAGDAGADKPATAPVEMALAGSDIAPGEHVWFVGDGYVDIECARNAGCFAILLRPEPPREGEFEPLEPVLHVRNCGELGSLVQKS